MDLVLVGAAAAPVDDLGPNKAMEDLVSNAFDADATRVHVVLSPDRAAADAMIAVVDNGTGVDGDQGLKDPIGSSEHRFR